MKGGVSFLRRETCHGRRGAIPSDGWALVLDTLATKHFSRHLCLRTWYIPIYSDKNTTASTVFDDLFQIHTHTRPTFRHFSHSREHFTKATYSSRSRSSKYPATSSFERRDRRRVLNLTSRDAIEGEDEDRASIQRSNRDGALFITATIQYKIAVERSQKQIEMAFRRLRIKRTSCSILFGGFPACYIACCERIGKENEQSTIRLLLRRLADSWAHFLFRVAIDGARLVATNEISDLLRRNWARKSSLDFISRTC